MPDDAACTCVDQDAALQASYDAQGLMDDVAPITGLARSGRIAAHAPSVLTQCFLSMHHASNEPLTRLWGRWGTGGADATCAMMANRGFCFFCPGSVFPFLPTGTPGVASDVVPPLCAWACRCKAAGGMWYWLVLIVVLLPCAATDSAHTFFCTNFNINETELLVAGFRELCPVSCSLCTQSPVSASVVCKLAVCCLHACRARHCLATYIALAGKYFSYSNCSFHFDDTDIDLCHVCCSQVQRRLQVVYRLAQQHQRNHRRRHQP